jgi:hypothetical protein
MFQWPIKRRLARGRRPGVEGKRGSQVQKAVVDAWIKEAKVQGIRSIICLLDERQLRFYEKLPMDLVSYYQSTGLNVVHINAPNMRKSSHIHPALRQKHDKGSEKSKYRVSQFKSLLPQFNYELDSLKKKAPQQWLLTALDSELQRQFRHANTKVSGITRHRVIAAILKSSGAPAISAETIKQNFVEKRQLTKPPARNS